MKKTGYDQFFQKARTNAGTNKVPPVRVSKIAASAANSAPASNIKDLRERVKKNQQRKKAKGIPWKLVGVSFLGLLITAFGYFEHDDIEKWLAKVEVSFVGKVHASGAAAEKPAAAAAKPGDKKAVEEAKGEKVAEAPEKKEFTEADINHFAKLNERKKELDAREEELNRMEGELNTQKAELEKRIEKIDSTRREIASVLAERVKTDEKKIDTLVQLYTNMKAPQAAKIFEDLEEDLAIDILGKMKKKNAADIMNLLKPEKAKIFSEKFAGYKRN